VSSLLLLLIRVLAVLELYATLKSIRSSLSSSSSSSHVYRPTYARIYSENYFRNREVLKFKGPRKTEPVFLSGRIHNNTQKEHSEKLKTLTRTGKEAGIPSPSDGDWGSVVKSLSIVQAGPKLISMRIDIYRWKLCISIVYFKNICNVKGAQLSYLRVYM